MNRNFNHDLNSGHLEMQDSDSQIKNMDQEDLLAITIVQPHLNLQQSLFREFSIIKTGFLNQEFTDYCMVKGASEQTIPLVLLIPLLMIVGIMGCIRQFLTNINQSENVFDAKFLTSLIQCCLLIAFTIIFLYLTLKGFEIIPKVIQKPLLIGKITTYIFLTLIIVQGYMMLEYLVLKPDSTNQFWSTIGLVVWQKLFSTYIYDIRLKAVFYSSLYLYFVFRVNYSLGDIFQNFYKCFLYLSVELILIVDIELKNYASYQLEKSITQTTNKLQNQEQVQFMIPPTTLSNQQHLLQNYSNIFPVAIFDEKRMLLHLSGVMQKLLQLDIQLNQENEIDLIQAELTIRKLEIVNVYDDDFNKKQKLNNQRSQAKLGSTCGLSENGDLLHSLLNGPALQQLRNGVQAPQYFLGAQQSEEQFQGPRHQNFSSEGLLDKVILKLIRSNKDQVKGIVSHKINKKPQKKDDKNVWDVQFFQFTLSKDPLSKSNNIILVLEDVTSLMGFVNSKQKKQTSNDLDIQQLKQLCLKSRSFASVQEQILKNNFGTYDILRSVQNLESSIASREQNIVHITVENIDLEILQQKIKRNFEQRFLDKNIKFTIWIDEKINYENFLTDNLKLQLIIDNLLENCLEATSQGIVKLNIGPDQRPNCLSVTVEDNGVGIPNAFFAQLNPSNQLIQDLQNSEMTIDSNSESIIKHNHLGIVSSNYNVKLIGPKIFNKTIGGHICSSGLHIQSVIDIGTRITFSIRNMTQDPIGQLYLMDIIVEDSEIDVEQEEILERYIIEKEQAQEDLYLIPRSNQNIKCQILKQSFTLVDLLKQDPNVPKETSPIIEGKPLLGLQKLQESGRRPIVIQKKNRFPNSGITISSRSIEVPIQQCSCDNILIINSDNQFFNVLEIQKMSIPWYDKAKVVSEKEAVKQINRKMIDNSCIPQTSQCQVYKTIVFNCSNDNVDYNNLINSIKQFYQKSQIQVGRLIVLSYRPFGIVPPQALIIQMPNLKWSESIA